MLEPESISTRQVESSESTKNVADALFRTVECLDESMLMKGIRSPEKYMGLVS